MKLRKSSSKSNKVRWKYTNCRVISKNPQVLKRTSLYRRESLYFERTLFSLDLEVLWLELTRFPSTIGDSKWILLTNWWSLDSIASILAELFVLCVLYLPQAYSRPFIGNRTSVVSFPLMLRVYRFHRTTNRVFIERLWTKGMSYESHHARSMRRNSCLLSLGQYIPVYMFEIFRTYSSLSAQPRPSIST